MTWFSGAWPGAAPEEIVDGVRVIRRGGQMTVHLHAWRWLRRRVSEYDRVVDQVNTIPFFTPAYVDAPRRRLLIHQLAREYWWRETRGLQKAIAPVGYALEPLYLRAYRRTTAVTISASTKADLVRLGLPQEDVAIFDMALDAPAVAQPVPKQGPLRLIMLGRLTPAKFVEEGVQAFLLIRRTVPDARLDIVGAGDDSYRERLAGMVAAAGATTAVTFHGRVPTAERQRLLEEAHVHVFTSHREGWGLTVSEAAGAGTPSVGYDAPGVRDSIGEPALLAAIGDVRGIADAVLRLHRDPSFANAVTDRMWRRASAMDYDRTAQQLLEAIT